MNSSLKLSISLGSVIVAFASGIAYADDITVYNETSSPVWAAVYSYKKYPLEQTSAPMLLAAKSATKVQRFDYTFWTDRYLLVSLDSNQLQPTISKEQLSSLVSINIGKMHGSNFYINVKDGKLKGYNWVEWKAAPAFDRIGGVIKDIQAYVHEKTETTKEYLSLSVRDSIKLQLPAVQNNPYKNTVARVRTGKGVAPQEQAFLEKRRPIVKRALEQFLGRSLEGKHIPTIAAVNSGGGCRAMIGAIGEFSGFETIGLLNGITYMVGLSGSTWFMSTWVSSRLSLGLYVNRITPLFSGGMSDVSQKEAQLIAQALLTKAVFNQPLTLIDIYNALLVNKFFRPDGDRRHQIYLSDQAEIIKEGAFPFPIYTAVRAEEFSASEWYEFNPIEVGDVGGWMGDLHVPAWGYGRRFERGVSVDFAPEQSMPLGTWGSALGANFENMYSRIELKIENENLKKVLSSVMVDALGHKRITWAEVFNFSHGINQSSLKVASVLKLVDAGAKPGFNLPYPPVSRDNPHRAVDIIIFCDYSTHLMNGGQLPHIYAYANKRGYKLPNIASFDQINKSSVNVFKNENDPSVPVIIYISRIHDPALIEAVKTRYTQYAPYLIGFNIDNETNKGYCETSNFSYTPAQVKQLSTYAELQVVANKGLIVDAINWVIDKKS